MSDESILQRLEEQGHTAPRVILRGTTRSEADGRRYDLGDEIARGGVGAIHRGRDNDLGRDVALKVLHDKHMRNPDLVQRFIEEAQIGGQLQHPGIVPVYELGLLSDKRPYFAMKLVKGETLAAHFARRADASEDRRMLLSVFRDVCRTMAYAHARGVVHRDLKPANIMIGGFGEVQVVDWGLGKVLRKGGIDDELLQQRAHDARTLISTVRSGDDEADSLTGSIMGTPAYMPPEQALGQVESLDEKSDIFSLGAILCELLTGAAPYQGSRGECLAKARGADLVDARRRLADSTADEDLTSLCLACLEPLPNKRPRSAGILADAVAAHLAASEGRAHRAGLRALKAGAEADAQARARRQTRTLAFGGLAVVLLGLGVWLFLDHGARSRERQRQQALQSAVEETTRFRAAGNFTGALAAAERARDLGDASGLTAAIKAQAEAAHTAASEEQTASRLRLALDDLRGRYGAGSATGRSLPSGADLDRPARLALRVDAAYAAAFETRFGGVAKSTEALRGTEHATAIAASVAHWRWLRRTVAALADRETAPLDALTDALDPTHAALRSELQSVTPEGRVAWLDARTQPLPLEIAPGLAFILMQEGHLERARDLLRDQHARHPDDLWVHLRLADVAEHFGESGRAQDHAMAALTLDAMSLPARLRLGRARLHLGSLKKAASAYEGCLALDGRHGDAHLGLGIVRLEQGRHDDALKHLRLVEAADGENAAAWRARGLALVAKRDHEGATDAFRKAVAHDTTYANAFADLGALLLRRSDATGAVAAIRRGLAAEPGHMRLHILLSRALLVQHAPEAAIVAAREAVAIAPLDARAHAALGRALVKNKELLEAKTSLKRALALDAHCSAAWTGLANIEQSRRRHRSALAFQTKATQADPHDLEAREELGERERELFENHAVAITHYEAVLAIDPTRVTARARIALAHADAGDRPAAVAAAEAAVAMDSKSADARYAHARALAIDEGRVSLSAAAEAFRAAHERDPKNILYLQWLSLCLRRMGRLTDAKAAIDSALRLEPHNYNVCMEALNIDRWIRWLPRLDAVKSSEVQPRSSIDLEVLGQMFRYLRGDMAAYLEMYRRTIPVYIPGGFVAGHPRHNAAQAAVLTGPAHHAEALVWLQEELAHLREKELTNRPASVLWYLQKWKADPDFRVVRDGADVPAAWKALWADVDKLQDEARLNMR